MSARNLQAFLRGGGTFEDLAERYTIKARRHGEHPNLVLFKYGISAPFAEPIVCEARGVVLDEARDWTVVAQAFTKFHNLGDPLADIVDWSTARVQEKCDGSLCLLYPYAGKWHVATTGTPDACGDVHLSRQKFADLFFAAVEKMGGTLPEVDCGRCYFFELTSPFNRIVVRHAELGLTLLGARDLATLKEIDPQTASNDFGCWVRVVREFPLQSFEEIAASFADMNPLAQEGYVVVDENFCRVKVKHPGYVALHHAKDGLSLKAFVEIARKGESSDVMSAFPEFAGMLDEARLRVERFIGYLEGAYDAIKDIEAQKDFALRATKTRCSAPLFLVRSKKVATVREAVAGMQIDRLLDLLGYRNPEAPIGGEP